MDQQVSALAIRAGQRMAPRLVACAPMGITQPAVAARNARVRRAYVAHATAADLASAMRAGGAYRVTDAILLTSVRTAR